MRPDLLPTAPLSQVIFIHDYLQLLFGDVSFSIYNPSKLTLNGVGVLFRHAGFCDSLVSLLGQPLKSVSAEPTLTLSFQNGAVLVVAKSGFGPEAWQYCCPGAAIVVEQNA